MRKIRWTLLVLLVAAIAVVVAGYRAAEKRNLLLAPAKPAPIPKDLHSIANNWSWSQSSKDHPVVEAHARDFRQIKDSSRFELGELEMKVFTKTGDTYDLVRSAKAEFDQVAEKLYSEGDVTITLGLPAASPPVPGKRYVEIRTSGLTYDNRSGASDTDRPVHFQFENGEGNSVGAVYDANKHYLWMKSQAEVIGAGPQAGMHIRAGELHYYEDEQKIDLRPWSKLERGGQGVEGGDSTVYLDKGDLKRVETRQGKGWDITPDRETRFSGNSLEVNFTAGQTVADAAGVGDAQIVSQTATGVVKMTGGRVDLNFTALPDANQSELTGALVRGHGRVESVPAASQERSQPETKILTAETIKVEMMPGGRELRRLETVTPGRLEFLPNQPGQWKRTLTAARLWTQYGPGNRPETLRAVGEVQLRSDPPASRKGARPGEPAPPRLTWSDGLEAFFNPQDGQMKELHQWSHFRYEEGPRHATANGARFDVPNDRTTLEGAARVWDETSLTTADLLILDEKQDRLHAEGNVTSTHLDKPATGQAPSDALFDSGKPMHATAQKFDSEQRNHVLHYRGSARLWQDGNSVQAQEIDLDREEKTLHARGGVSSVLLEQQPASEPGSSSGQAADAGKPAPSRLVTISSDSLLYTDDDHRAFYTGQVVLRRERMTIRAGELEAVLRPQGAAREKGESRLERALARSKVEIVETAAEKRAPRKAHAEQAEYTSGEEKVVLRGGVPTLEQPDHGFTRGAELTYYIDDDRLLVNGRPGARSQSRQKLKRN